MAYDPAIEEEIRRRKAEEALAAEADTGATADEQPQEEEDAASAEPTPTPEPAPAPEEQQPVDVGKKGAYEYELIPESAIKPPAAPAAPPPATPLAVPVPTPESPTAPADIQTDADTGTRYVQDQDQKIPHAELATPQEKEAQPPDATLLPKQTVQGETQVQPAPDRLNQVERAQLVKLPAAQPAPDTLAQTEKAQPPDYTAPTQAPPQSQKITAAPPPPSAPSSLFGMPVRGMADPMAGAKPIPAGPVTSKAEPIPTDTNFPERVQAVGDVDPKAFIVHHTSGRGTVDGVVSTLKERGFGVQYVMDRSGQIYQTGGPGAANIKNGWGAGAGLNNQNVVGMEIIANNDKDVTPQQAQSFAKFIAARYPTTPLYGHGEVNPGHKEADEGLTAKQAAEAYRASGGSGGDTSTAAGSGYVSGKATTFGYKDTGDPGVGAPKLGTINTNDPDLVGIAVPEDALRRTLGSNPALWRQARVDVKTKDGRHMLVPIVDLGPGDEPQNRGVAADFTHNLHQMLGNTGEETYGFKIVPNAGPDVEKDPQAFIAEQRQLMTGADTRPKQKAASTAGGGFELVPEAEVSQQQQAAPTAPVGNEKEFATLNAINDQTPNRGELWKKLQGDVPGVSPQALQTYRNQVKQQITDYALDYYKGSDPKITSEQAFQRATSDADFGTFAGEVTTKIMPNFTKAAIAMSRGQDTIDENRVNQFLNAINPNLSPEKRVEFKREMMAMNPTERAQHVGALLAQDPVKLADFNAPELADSFDRIADPAYQAKRKAAIDLAVAKNNHDLQTDPRLASTPAEGVTQFMASLPKNLAETFTGPIGQSAMLSEIYYDSADQMRREHPDWSEDDIKQKASASTLAQLGPQEVIMAMTGGALHAATKGITQPALELGARLGLHGTTAGVMGGLQQLAKNATEGRPLMDGVTDAVAAGGAMGVVGGALAGRTHPEAEHAPVEATPPPTEPPARVEPPIEKTEPVVTPPEPPPKVVHEPAAPEERPEASEEDLSRGNDELYRKMETGQEPPEAKDAPETPDHAPPSDDANTKPPPTEPPPAEPPPTEPPKAEPPPPPPPEPPKAEPPPTKARIPSINDIKMTPEERAAFAPETAGVKAAFKQGQKDGWSAPSVQDFTAAYKQLQDKVISRWQAHLDALGVKSYKDSPDFNPAKEMHMAAGIDRDGNMFFHNNVPSLAERAIRIMQDGGDPLHDLHQGMREELIHFAHLKALRDRWDKSPEGKTVRDMTGGRSGVGKFIMGHSKKVVRESLATMDHPNTDPANAKLIRDALVNSRKMYGRTSESNAAAEAGWRNDLRAADNGDVPALQRIHNATAELVRQLAQAGKRGDTTEGVFQKVMAGVKEWYQTALQGLKDLYRQLKPGQLLAKTELARLIKAVEKEIKAVDRTVAEGHPADVKTTLAKAENLSEAIRRTRASEEITTAKASAQTTGKKHWWEQENKPWELRNLWKQTMAGGESAMLDHNETKGLARAIKRRASAEQEIGSRIGIHQYLDAWKKVPWRQRDRVSKEFQEWIKAEQTGAAKPAIGADTERLIKLSKDVKERIGTEMDRLNVHVKDSQGKVRKVRLIGRDYWPRVLTDEFKDMIERRDGARANDFNAFVSREIGRGKAKTRDEVVDRYTRQDPGDEYSNEPFSNMERARENHTPHEGVDYHPNSDFRYMSKSIKRLAQIDSFGQKLSNKGRDLHDIAINKVEQSGNLSRRAKDIIINRIHEQSRNEYGNLRTDPLNGLSSKARALASGTFLGNPISSFYNALSGGAHNLAYGGVKSFARTLLDAPKYGMLKAEAKDRNILRENMSEMVHDLDLAHDQSWLTKGIRGYNSKMMKWGGQNETEALNRTFAMQQGKHWLREFTKGYGRDSAPMRHMMGQLDRLNFNKSEINDLYNEHGQGPKTDEFLRQWVLQTHGSYDASQTSPKIFDSPTGKVLMQFQKWAANAGRVYIREFAAPMNKARQDWLKNPTDPKANADLFYHMGRQLAYLGVGYGAGSLAMLGRQWMTGAPSQDATTKDIMKLVQNGDSWHAFNEALGKAWHAMVMSGFLGTVGNYADLIQNFTGAAKGNRVKDPRQFATLGIIQPFIDFAQGALQEQALGPAAPSQNIVHKLADTISAFRTGLPIGLNAMNHMGIKTAPGDQMKGRNDYMALKMHLAQYESQNPELVQKAAMKGSKAITSTGRSPADPVREDIQRNLVSGNPTGVNKAINDYLLRLPAPARKDALDGLKTSIRMTNPVNPGGSNSLQSAIGFLSWAKQNLPEDEARQLFNAAQTYASTAMQTKLFAWTPGTAMPFLSKVDYDKFQPHAVAAKAENAKAKALGEFMARQKAADTLRNR